MLKHGGALLSSCIAVLRELVWPYLSVAGERRWFAGETMLLKELPESQGMRETLDDVLLIMYNIKLNTAKMKFRLLEPNVEQ